MPSFQSILHEVTGRTPQAVGAAFAAWDGEIVEFVTEWENDDWLALTAHYGIVLAHVQSALNTFHFGGARTLAVTHGGLDILVEDVLGGYYALLALTKGSCIAKAGFALRQAAVLLREEME